MGTDDLTLKRLFLSLFMMQCMACSNDTGPDVITDQTPPSPWDPIGKMTPRHPLPKQRTLGGHLYMPMLGWPFETQGMIAETGVDEPTGGLPDGGVDCSFPVDYDNDGYVDHRCGGDDCNDENPYIHPGANEACDNDDNNCDGNINEGLECWFYAHSSTSLYKLTHFYSPTNMWSVCRPVRYGHHPSPTV